METAYIIQIIASVILAVTVAVIWRQGNRTLHLMTELQGNQFKEAEQARLRDHRDKALDEIAAWASNITNCFDPPTDVRLASMVIDPTTKPGAWYIFLYNIAACLARSASNSHHMKLLASPFTAEFQLAVRQLAEELDTQRKLASEFAKTVRSESETADWLPRVQPKKEETEEGEHRLKRSIDEVLEETLKLKTQDPPTA